MLYPCTISAVNSSFDRDKPTPNTNCPRPRPLAMRGRRCRWLRMRDVVTRHGDGDGSDFGEDGGAAAA
jgi:hypothetical protein